MQWAIAVELEKNITQREQRLDREQRIDREANYSGHSNRRIERANSHIQIWILENCLTADNQSPVR